MKQSKIKAKYVLIYWRVPDYGGTDAQPFIFNSKEKLIKFLKEYSPYDYKDMDIYPVATILKAEQVINLVKK